MALDIISDCGRRTVPTPTPFRQVAGVFEGDEIVSVNGEPAASWDPKKIDSRGVSWKFRLEEKREKTSAKLGFSC